MRVRLEEGRVGRRRRLVLGLAIVSSSDAEDEKKTSHPVPRGPRTAWSCRRMKSSSSTLTAYCVHEGPLQPPQGLPDSSSTTRRQHFPCPLLHHRRRRGLHLLGHRGRWLVQEGLGPCRPELVVLARLHSWRLGGRDGRAARVLRRRPSLLGREARQQVKLRAFF